MAGIAVKICGVRNAQTAIAAARAGADYLGFVLFRKSPRYLAAEAVEDIVVALKQSSFDEGFDLPILVGLFVDAGEKEMAPVAPFLNSFQFHGHESPERCAEIGTSFGVDIIKALPVATAEDVALADPFIDAADMLLFDAKPPPGAARPGGHGVSYDWSALKVYKAETPYLVAGGLTPENVSEAVAVQSGHTAFAGVDVSSGVESAVGEKDLEKVAAFIKAAKAP